MFTNAKEMNEIHKKLLELNRKIEEQMKFINNMNIMLESQHSAIDKVSNCMVTNKSEAEDLLDRIFSEMKNEVGELGEEFKFSVIRRLGPNTRSQRKIVAPVDIASFDSVSEGNTVTQSTTPPLSVCSNTTVDGTDNNAQMIPVSDKQRLETAVTYSKDLPGVTRVDEERSENLIKSAIELKCATKTPEELKNLQDSVLVPSNSSSCHAISTQANQIEYEHNKTVSEQNLRENNRQLDQHSHFLIPKQENSGLPVTSALENQNNGILSQKEVHLKIKLRHIASKEKHQKESKSQKINVDEQIRILKRHFDINKLPNAELIVQISGETGLSVDQIENWYQYAIYKYEKKHSSLTKDSTVTNNTRNSKTSPAILKLKTEPGNTVEENISVQNVQKPNDSNSLQTLPSSPNLEESTIQPTSSNINNIVVKTECTDPEEKLDINGLTDHQLKLLEEYFEKNA